MCVCVCGGGGGGGGERGGGSVCSLANYSVAYEETQSNRVSDFCDFVCFQKQSFLTFILNMATLFDMKPGAFLNITFTKYLALCC